jgi:hypothetical protein
MSPKRIRCIRKMFLAALAGRNTSRHLEKFPTHYDCALQLDLQSLGGLMGEW